MKTYTVTRFGGRALDRIDSQTHTESTAVVDLVVSNALSAPWPVKVVVDEWTVDGRRVADARVEHLNARARRLGVA